MDLRILLGAYATSKKYGKHEIIFEEGALPRFFHIVLSGKVEMFYLSEDGKEFTQGLFSKNESFGEPPLILNLRYPASARAKEESEILRIGKEKFFELLDSSDSFKNEMLSVLARRIYSKSLGQNSLSYCEPEKRILLILEKYRFDNHLETGSNTIFPLTRQELANITGLRIETVIRALSKMKQKGTLQFSNKKIIL